MYCCKGDIIVRVSRIILSRVLGERVSEYARLSVSSAELKSIVFYNKYTYLVTSNGHNLFKQQTRTVSKVP